MKPISATFDTISPTRAMASLRGERSHALFNHASKAMAEVQGDSLTLRFFEHLRDKGQEMIQAEMRQADEEDILFRSW